MQTWTDDLRTGRVDTDTMRRRPWTLCGLAAAVLVVGCGPTGGPVPLDIDAGTAPVATGIYESRCRSFCQRDAFEDETVCGPADVEPCTDHCVRQVAGLTAGCAACVIDEGFGRFGVDGVCYPGSAARVSTSDCAGLCQVDHPGGRAELQQRCELYCDTTFAGPSCGPAARADCVEDCRATVAGLDYGCAVCLVDEGGWIEADGDLCFYGPARIGASDCAPFCDGPWHPGGAPELDARCAAFCNTPDCSGGGAEACLTECRARVAGLSFECGVCLMDEGYSPGYLGGCGFALASITSSECAQFCIDP